MVVRYTTQQHAQQAPSTVLLDVDRRCYFTVHIALYVLSRASNLFTKFFWYSNTARAVFSPI